MGLDMCNESICVMCKLPIRDSFLLRVGLSVVHEACLKCFSCGSSLTQSCVVRAGHFYCKRDFYTIYGPRCVGCQLKVDWREKVRKIGESFFHGTCFKCSDCAQDLSEAKLIGCDINGNLLCETDFIKQKEVDTPDLKKEASLVVEDGVMVGPDKKEDDEDTEVGKEDDSKEKRKRGPKTTIQPNQLTILRTCFDKNPKPSPKIFEELSKDTGLTKRVIQVWFQNRRSKNKRISKMHTLMQVGFPADPSTQLLPPWDMQTSCYPLSYPPHHHHQPPDFSYTGYTDVGYLVDNNTVAATPKMGYAAGTGGGGGGMPAECFPSPPILPTDFPELTGAGTGSVLGHHPEEQATDVVFNQPDS